MAREYSRSQRVADYLKRELAALIQHSVRDPRITMVNVNDVQVSRDISHAKVYVTFIDKDNEEEAEELLEVMNRASGFLRTQIAGDSSMRIVPKLRFYFDTSVGRGHRVSDLISKAIKADKKFRNDDSLNEE